MTPLVNEELATLSDQLTLVAVLLYLVAMICFALDLAFGRIHPASAVKAREPVAVGAGGGGPSSGEPGEAAAAGGAATAEGAPWAAKAGLAGIALTWIGWAAHLAAIVTRGLAVDRWPWGNMYEFVVGLCLAAVTAFLVLLFRHRIRFLGAFVTLAAALGLGFAVLFLHVQAGPLMPALQSYWLAIHVSAAIVASGLFTVAGVSAILYLVRKDRPSVLPTREALDTVVHRAIVIGFPIWTFAVIAGALWADRAWGRYWGWDPKEVWSFITWVVYAAYLHARATAGWKGKAAIISLVAFACLLFNLIGVNIFFPGLHSYSDIPR